MEKYRPSNGTEGMWFTSNFCEQCVHEKFMHTQCHKDKKCGILSASLMYGINEPEYPKEWVYNSEEPTCTEFVKFDWGNDEDGWNDPDGPDSPFAPIDPNQLLLPFDIMELFGFDDVVVTKIGVFEANALLQ
jgi:hypothetical protein